MKPETELQRRCVAAGRSIGAEILSIGGKAFTRVNTNGAPDTFIYAGAGRWKAVEIKTPTGKVSPEQMKLASEGKIRIVRSVDEFIVIGKECIENARYGER